MTRAAIAATVAIAGLTLGCELEPDQLPPLGEALVIVDTDVDVPALLTTLRVDVYDLDGTWRLSQTIPRNDPATWPVSFSVFTPDEQTDREVLLRLRLYPENKVRDYRGEKWIPEDVQTASPDTCAAPPEEYVDDKRLLVVDEQGVVDRTPLEEPLPKLTIDRLVHLQLTPGVAGSVRLELAGACLGTEANLFDKQTCTDTEKQYRPVTPSPLNPDMSLPDTSRTGAFPGLATCNAPVREDESCIEGGAFVLGDPGVFGFGDFDGFPERVAVIAPLRIDRFEVTVGRFRGALDDGLLAGVDLPVANEGELAGDSLAAPETQCTWSASDIGRESHPLNCVSWRTARSFCQAIGGDLPTEAQWEYVAAAASRGRQDRFPWGSEDATCGVAVHGRSDLPNAGDTRCASFGFGVQPVKNSGDATPIYGVVGMGGNVREWTLDAYRSYCTGCWDRATLHQPMCDEAGPNVRRSVRGGDWADPPELLLSAIRDEGLEPATTSSRIGFRCTRPGAE